MIGLLSIHPVYDSIRFTSQFNFATKEHFITKHTTVGVKLNSLLTVKKYRLLWISPKAGLQKKEFKISIR